MQELNINKTMHVKKVLLKKKLKSYIWYSESAYKYIHNRFRCY